MVEWVMAWVSFWIGIIGTLLGVYSAATSPESRQVASRLLNSGDSVFRTGRAAVLTDQILSRLLGKKVVGFTSFLRSIAWSAFVFTGALSVALVTSPPGLMLGIRDMLTNLFSPLLTVPSVADDYMPVGESYASKLAFFSITASFAWEYIFIVKSRTMLRRVGETWPTKKILALTVTDLLTTFVLFCLVFPVTEMAAAAIMQAHEAPSFLASGTIADPIDQEVIQNYYSASAGVIYLERVFNTAHILYMEIRSGFSKYFAIPILTNSRAFIPLTTFLVGAFATAAWSVVMSVTLLFCRAYYQAMRSSRRIFFAIHQRPESIVLYGLIPSVFVMIIGTITLTQLAQNPRSSISKSIA